MTTTVGHGGVFGSGRVTLPRRRRSRSPDLPYLSGSTPILVVNDGETWFKV